MVTLFLLLSFFAHSSPLDLAPAKTGLGIQEFEKFILKENQKSFQTIQDYKSRRSLSDLIQHLDQDLQKNGELCKSLKISAEDCNETTNRQTKLDSEEMKVAQEGSLKGDAKTVQTYIALRIWHDEVTQRIFQPSFKSIGKAQFKEKEELIRDSKRTELLILLYQAKLSKDPATFEKFKDLYQRDLK